MYKINFLSKIVILVFSLVVSIVLLGCTMGKDYTYENIVTEYNLKHYETTPSTQSKSEPDLSYLKRPISILDGIKIAIHNNPDIDIAISRIRQSEATIDEANAAFWPSLAFYTEYVKADSPSTYLFRRIDQRRLASGTDFNDPGRIENFEIGFSARWNIYNGGRDVLRKKMSETGLVIPGDAVSCINTEPAVVPVHELADEIIDYFALAFQHGQDTGAEDLLKLLYLAPGKHRPALSEKAISDYGMKMWMEPGVISKGVNDHHKTWNSVREAKHSMKEDLKTFPCTMTEVCQKPRSYLK
jgi:hypothetical protein